MLRLVASWGDRKPHPRIEQFRSMAVKHVEIMPGCSRVSQAPFRKRGRYMNSRYLFMLIGAGWLRPEPGVVIVEFGALKRPGFPGGSNL